MTMGSEFDPFLEMQPPSVRAFIEVLRHTNRHLQTLHQQFMEKYGHPSVQREVSIENIDRSPQPLTFMSADAVRLFQITPPPAEYASGAAEVALQLYKEDSPHTFDEDVNIILSAWGNPQSSNIYNIYCFAEHPPVILNANEFEKFGDLIKEEKLKLDAQLPGAIVTIEDVMKLRRAQGKEVRILSEESCGQLITILNDASFEADFNEFEECEPTDNRWIKTD